MRQLAAVFLLPFLMLPSAAQDGSAAPSGQYASDPAHTSVHWRIRHFGLSNYTARFTGIEADLAWNREEPTQSTLSVRIDPLSVETDFPFVEQEDFDATIGRAEHLLGGQPIIFRSTGVEITGERTGVVSGELTFRGETHPAELNVIFNGSMAKHPLDGLAKLGFSASATIHRSTWGLDFALDALGDEVDLLIEAEFVPTAPRR